MAAAIHVVAALTLMSGLVVMARMRETLSASPDARPDQAIRPPRIAPRIIGPTCAATSAAPPAPRHLRGH